MEFTSIESEYLVALLKCALKSQNVPDIPAGLNWKELVNISKKQQVYSTIAPIINKINIPPEQAQELIYSITGEEPLFLDFLAYSAYWHFSLFGVISQKRKEKLWNR